MTPNFVVLPYFLFLFLSKPSNLQTHKQVKKRRKAKEAKEKEMEMRKSGNETKNANKKSAKKKDTWPNANNVKVAPRDATPSGLKCQSGVSLSNAIRPEVSQ